MAPPKSAPGTGQLLPMAAMVAASVAIGGSPTFVRLADVGPIASAFWRVSGALPLLLLWALLEARNAGQATATVFRIDKLTFLAGLLFAVDLIVWHLAITRTAVANASFLALMMPIWVLIGGWIFLRERAGLRVVAGILISFAGAVAFVGHSYSFRLDYVEGDLLAVATSIFFAGYYIAVRAARRGLGPGRVVFLSSLTAAVILLPISIATGEQILPEASIGLGAIIGLAFVSHFAGQGLTTYALGHLPAAFASLVTYLGAVAGVVIAWLVLGESISRLQVLGGVLVIAGIVLATPRQNGSESRDSSS